MITTIELQVDEKIVERARRAAVRQHVTLETLIKEMVESLATVGISDDSILGMFAQEPDLMDAVTADAMLTRETVTLRLSNG